MKMPYEMIEDLRKLVFDLFDTKVFPSDVNTEAELRRTLHRLSQDSRVLSPMFCTALESKLLIWSPNPFGANLSKIAQAPVSQQIEMFVQRLFQASCLQQRTVEEEEKDRKLQSTVASALIICKAQRDDEETFQIGSYSRAELEQKVALAIDSLGYSWEKTDALKELRVLAYRQYGRGIDISYEYKTAFVSEFFNTIYGTLPAKAKKKKSMKTFVLVVLAFCVGSIFQILLKGL